MTEETKKRNLAYNLAYQKKTYANLSFKVKKVEDKDIIDKLNSVPSKSDYIKKLIRDDMSR